MQGSHTHTHFLTHTHIHKIKTGERSPFLFPAFGLSFISLKPHFSQVSGGENKVGFSPLFFCISKHNNFINMIIS